MAAGRLGLPEAMRQAMVDVVERVLGREVRSLMSANDLQHNLQVEVFVLTWSGTARSNGTAVGDAADGAQATLG